MEGLCPSKTFLRLLMNSIHIHVYSFLFKGKCYSCDLINNNRKEDRFVVNIGLSHSITYFSLLIQYGSLTYGIQP